MTPRRMPTKQELLRLQKLYRTDKRIADVLGNGVTEQLVAYWRRKKGIANYSFPKFSPKEIQEVWDRFGDDFHAGLELGLSKAAFYNWRRRYKITKKPDALKLEQLSLELFTQDRKARRQMGTGHQTIVQKIFAQRSGQKEAPVAQAVEIEPDLAVTPGGSGEVLQRFQETGVTFVWNPSRMVIPLDGAPGGEAPTAATLKSIRDFVRRQEIKSFFEIGEGNPQQIIMERTLILPGQIAVDTDSDFSALGCIGALVLSINAAEMSAVWAKGKFTTNIPDTIRVQIAGRTPRGVFARDVAHQVLAQLAGAGATGNMIEFYGPAVEQMSISERFTLCVLCAAVKARAAICPYDATTRRYVSPRARKPFTPILADRNAEYAAEYTHDVNRMTPVAAGPNRMTTTTPLDELRGVRIQQVFIGGGANGRFDDLKIAADILKGKHVNPDVRMIMQPASRSVYLEALKKGLIRVFIEAGGVVANPGTLSSGGPTPPLAKEEKGLTTNIDYRRDTGDGDVYQVSPATAAVSALTGQITNPAAYVKV
jgi:homoaconitase/3-isopropylmalate dehydratase large subunit